MEILQYYSYELKLYYNNPYLSIHFTNGHGWADSVSYCIMEDQIDTFFFICTTNVVLANYFGIHKVAHLKLE